MSRRTIAAFSRSTVSAALAFALAPQLPAQVHLGSWASVDATQVSRECTGPDGSAVAGDLDGDGQRDKATLLRNQSKGRLGVFVHVGPKTNVWQPVVIFPKGTDAHDVCLLLVPPGSYKTACGLSYDKGHNVNCRLGEPENIDLETNGIEVHLVQRVTLFYWDKKTKRFTELVMKGQSRGAPQ